jgi:saccharopine dehydrogenase-like NADP-dependent oxidoreductase
MPNGSVFDGYPNRDSLHYKDIYELNNALTLIRGTLRYPGYCKGWNAIVNLGLTENQTIINHSGDLTYADILNRLSISNESNLKNKLKADFPNLIDEEVIQLFDSIGLLSNKKCKRTSGTLAEYLQDLLEDAWKLKDNDRDLVVMQHIFEYSLAEKTETLRSSLFVEGETSEKTAMAKTVGLPLALGVNKIIESDFNEYGVQIPTVPEWYEPILTQLESFNIRFDESQ